MNKKKDIIALALSVSFVMGGASLSHADEINSDTTSYISENQSGKSEPSVQNLGNDDKNITEVNNNSNKKDNEDLLLSEEKTPKAQGAGESGSQAQEDKNLQKADDPNYGEDEKKIQDYNGSGRYRETDLQPGDTNQESKITDQGEAKDGLEFNILNPSSTSPSKTGYGYQITIDKKTGQRTYTKIYVTDSGLIPVDPGEKAMVNEGDRLTPESPGVNYKPNENTKITASRQQRNLNYEASEKNLSHINNQDNDSTSFGFKDNYSQDNPAKKFFGPNFALGYKVNPWPNENDKLELLKLNGSYNEKVFVQGQDIDTGIKVDNIDGNAKKRLVGQVYNPITGDIVPGASAYIGDNGNIHIKMPEGALKKDENGKTVINEDSIFNTPDYKALQNLDVRFFARPRTEKEFKTIAETPDEFGETGTYTGSGAGTANINHKGTNVTIDKQGIDRYDHYNLIGGFKLNLDDTRYYDQSFKDGLEEDTSDKTYSKVKPGEAFNVEMFVPESKKPNQKTAEKMNEADKNGQASGRIIMDFLNKENEGKAPEDRWKIDVDEHDISKFTITPPKSAKAGDFVAIPVEYTYTNGSKDVHWFHFVVQESDNFRPEYHAEVGYKGDTLTNNHEKLPSKDETKKNLPTSYELVPGEYKDSAGNVWADIKVDSKTGTVTAKVPEDANIKGGENLFVDVKVNYIDKAGDKHEEVVKAQFIARPKYQTEVTKEYETKIPYKTKVVYDETLESGKVIEKAGEEGKQKLTFKQVVINDKKGIIDENGEFQEGKEAVTTETITDAVDGEVRIGTKPAKTTVEIPFDTDYELDYTKKKGEKPTEVTEGKKGEITVKTTRDPETGEIKITQEVTKNAKNRKISIPAGTEGTHEYTEKKPFTYDIQFDPDFYKNYPDAKDNYKIVTEGIVGEKTTKWTIKNSEIVGEAEIIKDTEPTNAVIKVGQKDYTGTITHTEKHEVPFEVEYRYSNELEAGQTKVEQKGEKGSYEVEYSQKIKNGGKDGELTFTKKNEKAAKKEIIIIGTKPVTKVVEKPFNTEYEYDETLDAGKIEEKNPGKNGKVTITTSYDQKEKKVVTTETEEKAKNRVVRVGTKPNENMCPIPEEPNKTEKPENREKQKNPNDSSNPQKQKNKDNNEDNKDGDKEKASNPSRKLEKPNPTIKNENANENPKTGITSLSTVLSTLGISFGALGFSKKRKKK